MSERDALIAGRYRLVNRLGSGGMGIVWEAWDERLRRPVALKELHPQLGLSPAQAELAKSRAMREARITARLHHPHAVPVFDVVEHEGQPCMIMQYLPSQSLHTLLNERGRLSPTEVARIGAEVASALAAAHQAGIVHRDVKPGNVLIAKDGSAKISDFGISHALGDVTLTSTGMLTGTPAYLAPEVARGSESTFASDVFSLAATLYAAVEGVPPFGTHENPMALLHQVASGRVTPPTHSGELTPALERMLAAAPDDRPAMDEVARELRAVYAGPPATVEEQLPVAAAAATTQVLGSSTQLAGPTATTSSPGAGPPPSQPSPPSPPAQPGSSGDGAGGHRSRLGLAVVGGAIVLVLAVVLGLQLLARDPGPSAQPSPARSSTPATSAATSSTGSTSSAPSSSAATTTASQPASPAPPPPSTTAAATATAAPPPPSATAAATATAAPPPPSATPAATPTAAPPPPSATTPPPVSGPPTGAQLAQAVTDYYGFLPGNTDVGWSRLTARYQTTTARNRQTYQAYWDSIQRVAVSDATGAPPGAVRATITYSFKDGRTVQEVTAFGMVADGGVLKVDSSSVVSSR